MEVAEEIRERQADQYCDCFHGLGGRYLVVISSLAPLSRVPLSSI